MISYIEKLADGFQHQIGDVAGEGRSSRDRRTG